MNQDELEKKYKYPVIYFNEYFRRKPMRLAERECGSLFTMDEGGVNRFAYISLEDHQKEIEKRDELLEFCLPLMEYTHTRLSEGSEAKKFNDWLKEYGELKNGTK